MLLFPDFSLTLERLKLCLRYGIRLAKRDGVLRDPQRLLHPSRKSASVLNPPSGTMPG
jgi:hypothetical protein